MKQEDRVKAAEILRAEDFGGYEGVLWSHVEKDGVHKVTAIVTKCSAPDDDEHPDIWFQAPYTIGEPPFDDPDWLYDNARKSLVACVIHKIASRGGFWVCQYHDTPLLVPSYWGECLGCPVGFSVQP